MGLSSHEAGAVPVTRELPMKDRVYTSECSGETLVDCSKCGEEGVVDCRTPGCPHLCDFPKEQREWTDAFWDAFNEALKKGRSSP